ncbi:MAG: NUMOD3 domain-containing DNA-binding protein [Nanoarchaeota archaeon]
MENTTLEETDLNRKEINLSSNSQKLCKCGCSQETKIILVNNKLLGFVRGNYREFIHNHHNRGKHWKVKDTSNMGKDKIGKPSNNRGKHWKIKDTSNMKKPRTETHKKNLSKSHQGEKNYMFGKHHYEETKEKNRLFHLNKPRSEETKNKISNSLVGRKRSNETKQKMKEARAKLIIPIKDTKIEKKIQSFLKELNIEFFTHQYMKINHGYQCDIFIPSKNLIIECDGDFIHCNPIKYSSGFVRFPTGKKIITAQEIWERDKLRTSELIEKGFKVLRLWEHEIRVMNVEDFENILQEIKN